MIRNESPEPRSAPPPDVTFVVATYNVAPFVTEAVQSALDQTGVTCEVIVVDDASSDGTPDIVQRIADRDRRVKLLAQAVNRGPSHARNLAMARARGRWISVLDGDDVLLPDRSRRLMDLAAATGADVVADNFERMTLDGRPTGATMLGQAPGAFSVLIDPAAFIRGNVLFDRRARLGAIKPMVRTDFLRRHGIDMPEALVFAEDFIFCLACLGHGARLVVSSDRTYRYRMRSGSLSWRIGRAELDGLERELDMLGLGARSRDVEAALDAYKRGLRNAVRFSDVVAAAKSRRWAAAMRAGVRPGTLPLVLRFGSAALLKRLTAPWSRLREASGPGAATA